MNIDSGFIFSLLSALVMLGSLCVGFGILKGKVDHSIEENKTQTELFKHCVSKSELEDIIKRVDEDRTRNTEQHQHIFDSVNGHDRQIAELTTTLRAIEKSVDELKHDIRTGLRDIQAELKELRKQG
jgi:septal ring factor EnvC (AmiA/AmiB activator)